MNIYETARMYAIKIENRIDGYTIDKAKAIFGKYYILVEIEIDRIRKASIEIKNASKLATTANLFKYQRLCWSLKKLWKEYEPVFEKPFKDTIKEMEEFYKKEDIIYAQIDEVFSVDPKYLALIKRREMLFIARQANEESDDDYAKPLNRLIFAGESKAIEDEMYEYRQSLVKFKIKQHWFEEDNDE